MAECLFCKIVAGEIPSEKVFENEEAFAFRDIHPQAPVHVLVIPKRHIASAQLITQEDAHTLGMLHSAIAEVAAQEGVAQTGYRIISNVGVHGQQTVSHLHYHILGGRQLEWPPG